MMPLILSQRNDSLQEWMDRDDCDRELLMNTYRQFGRINRLLSGWDRIYRNHIKPIFQTEHRSVSILDIGCGGGDILAYLQQIAELDRFNAEFTGIDPDPRSIDYLQKQRWPDNIRFRGISSSELLREGKTYDVVISNHLMHHLHPPQLRSVCRDAEALATKKVIFSDIERSDIGYLSFSVFAPLLFRNSYIVKDGRISIRRSYRKDELRRLLSGRWTIKRQFPFRLLAILNLSEDHAE
jgi:2-polyprenyl-3-methyl-5-hydroxy-6-metoxy-1,4-benzoquinol methylase